MSNDRINQAIREAVGRAPAQPAGESDAAEREWLRAWYQNDGQDIPDWLQPPATDYGGGPRGASPFSGAPLNVNDWIRQQAADTRAAYDRGRTRDIEPRRRTRDA